MAVQDSVPEATEADVRQAHVHGAAGAQTQQASQQNLDQTHEAAEQSQSAVEPAQAHAQQAPSSAGSQAAPSAYGQEHPGAGSLCVTYQNYCLRWMPSI